MNARLEMLIDDIIVEDRARADVGDLTSLIRSIGELGLLQPVGVSLDGRLVFGERRLEACRQLGFATIPVRFLPGARDELHALRAELDENIERRQFSAIEAAVLRRRIKDLAVQTKAEDTRKPPVVEGDSDAPKDDEQRDVIELPAFSRPMSAAEVDAQVAQVTGYSITTLKRVDRIAEFVNCGDPATEEAARDALQRIESGAPVKPLLDKVLELHSAAEAAARGYVPSRPAVEASASSDVPRSALVDGSVVDAPAGRVAERPAEPAEVPPGQVERAVDALPAPPVERAPIPGTIPPLPAEPPVAHPGWDDIVEEHVEPAPAREPRNDDASGRPADEPVPAADHAVLAAPGSADEPVAVAYEALMRADAVIRSALHAINDGSAETLTTAADALEATASRLRAVAVTLERRDDQ